MVGLPSAVVESGPIDVLGDDHDEGETGAVPDKDCVNTLTRRMNSVVGWEEEVWKVSEGVESDFGFRVFRETRVWRTKDRLE